MLETVEIEPGGPARATVLWLHGLGADGHDFEPIAAELRLPEAMAVRFVFPHAPARSVTINAGMVMRAWFDIKAPQLSEQADVDAILESAALIERLIEREISAAIPAERIILAGFSQGGLIALQVGLRFKRPLAGIMALSTWLPSAATLTGEHRAQNIKVPIMMAHGRMDAVVPITEGRAARTYLENLGCSPQWHEYPMGHEVCYEEIHHIRAWLMQVLAPHL